MNILAYKIINLFLLFACGVLIVLLFFDDSGKYCAPVTKPPKHNSEKIITTAKDTLEFIP